MDNLTNVLTELEKEHSKYVFKSFNNNTAWELGKIIVDLCVQKQIDNIIIDISLTGRQIFHYCFDKTSPNNEMWITRKRNTVLHFYKSSFFMQTKLQIDNSNLQSKYGLDPSKYVAAGGSFPIIVNNVCSVIGAISVSGLKPHEDHNLITEALDKYLFLI